MQSLFGEQKSLLSLRGEFGKPPAAVPSSGPGSQMDVGSKGLHMLSPPGRPNALPEGGGPESRPCFRLGTQNPVNFFQLCGSVARPIFQCGGPESCHFFQFGLQNPVHFFSCVVQFSVHFFSVGAQNPVPSFRPICRSIYRPFFSSNFFVQYVRPIFSSNLFVQFFRPKSYPKNPSIFVRPILFSIEMNVL